MALARGRHQPAALRGPQWRQAPLNGISVAGATGLVFLAGRGPQRPWTEGGIQTPRAGCLSGGKPTPTARTTDPAQRIA
jgi:hypothetical protein